MPEFVRVRLDNGAHKTIPTAVAEAASLKPLKQSPTTRDGRLARTKHRVDKSGAAVATTTTREADASTSKED